MQKKKINGIEFAFVDQGSGPILMLVHGFPLDHTMWSAQIESLSRNYRVIAADLRGFGQSEIDAGDDVIDMAKFADDLAALLDALHVDEPIYLAGLSMGGYVAFQFAFKWPQRLRGLILCDTKAMNDTPEVAAARRETARLVLQNGPEALTLSMMPKLFADSTMAERPELADSLRQVMTGTDRRAVAAAALGMARRSDVRERLHEIDCPTLVIVGSHDIISPVEEMRAIAEGIAGAKFVEITDSGHMSPMEKPAEFNSAIEEFVSATES